MHLQFQPPEQQHQPFERKKIAQNDNGQKIVGTCTADYYL